MKGVSEIIVMILIVIIVIALIGLSYTFFSGSFSITTVAAQKSTEQMATNMLSEMRIVSLSSNNAIVKNIGQIDISNLTVFINGELADSNMTPSIIRPGEIGSIKIYDFVNVNDEIKIMSLQGSFDSKLANDPCSQAVACWNLDEAEGSNVYDSSGNGNGGTIYSRHENLIIYSQDYSSTAWGGYCGTKTNIVQGTTDVPAPDGTQTAAKFTLPATMSCGSSTSWGVLQTASPAITNDIYTVSVWLKGASGGELVSIGISDYHAATFILTNQWKMYTLTELNTHPGERGLQFRGTMPNTVFYAWGAQLERQNNAGLYTATSSTAVSDGMIIYAGQFPSPHTASKFTNGLQFGGTSYVRIPDSSKLDISNSITIEAWVNIAQVPSTDVSLIVDKQASGDSGYRLAVQKSGNDALIEFGTYNGVGSNELNSNNPMSLNQWHHVIGTWDGTTKRVYIDGVLENSVNWVGPIVNNDLNALIGADESWLDSFYFNGTIDEVRIYNKAV